MEQKITLQWSMQEAIDVVASFCEIKAYSIGRAKANSKVPRMNPTNSINSTNSIHPDHETYT